MNKKIILLALLTVVGVFGASQMVLAADPVLSISPATLNSTVNSTFNVSVQLNPENNKVCVVTGTINFAGLSCQNITVASGLMAATAPTCASPSFIIGIPQCTTVSQNIFTMSVRGNQVGQSRLSFAGLKIIGAGSNISSIWNGGLYNIVAVNQPVPEVTTQPTTPANTNQEVTPEPETITENDIPTGIGAEGQQASLATASSSKTITIIIVILLAIAVVGGGWYMLSKRKKKEA